MLGKDGASGSRTTRAHAQAEDNEGEEEDDQGYDDDETVSVSD